jgi:hypothetical protein
METLDVTITGEGLQNFDLYSALRAFEQGDLYRATPTVTRGLGISGLTSEGPPHLVASCDTQGGVEDLF